MNLLGHLNQPQSLRAALLWPDKSKTLSKTVPGILQCEDTGAVLVSAICDTASRMANNLYI